MLVSEIRSTATYAFVYQDNEQMGKSARRGSGAVKYSDLSTQALISACCGLLMALPFSVYDGSLPAWFALAPVLCLVASAKSRRDALACSAAFSLCWTGVSFSFLWALAAPGMVALCIYSSSFD